MSDHLSTSLVASRQAGGILYAVPKEDSNKILNYFYHTMARHAQSPILSVTAFV